MAREDGVRKAVSEIEALLSAHSRFDRTSCAVAIRRETVKPFLCRALTKSLSL
jgi:hypothetical protein